MPHVIPEAYAEDVDLQIPTATMDMAVYNIYDPESDSYTHLPLPTKRIV